MGSPSSSVSVSVSVSVPDSDSLSRSLSDSLQLLLSDAVLLDSSSSMWPVALAEIPSAPVDGPTGASPQAMSNELGKPNTRASATNDDEQVSRMICELFGDSEPRCEDERSMRDHCVTTVRRRLQSPTNRTPREDWKVLRTRQ